MARIVGGIATSHAPSMAYAYDKGFEQDPRWKPLFDGYKPARAWLKQAAPDVLIVFYNDHMDRFFFDAYPTFAIGVAERFPLADEGWGKRAFSELTGDLDFARHVTRALIRDEFDLTVCQELTIDHGILSPLPYLCEDPWPVKILPLAVNVIQHPVPTARRLYKLGQALRRAVETYDRDLRVVVMGTGGMSHQLHGTRFGFVNPDWDNYFMDTLESTPEILADYSHDDFMRLGGAESVEMIMWLGMRGALAPRVKRIYRHYYAPQITGYGLLVFEDAD